MFKEQRFLFFLVLLFVFSISNLLSQIKLLTHGKEFDKVAKIIVDSNLYNLDLIDSNDLHFLRVPNKRIRWAASVYKILHKKKINIYCTKSTSPHFGYSKIIIFLNDSVKYIFGKYIQELPNDLEILNNLFYDYKIDFRARGYCFDELITNMHIGTGFYDIPKKRFYLCEEKQE